MLNKKVIIKDDVDGLSGFEGMIVGIGEEDCAYGTMYEVQFKDGSSEWLMECDLIQCDFDIA